MCFWQIYYRYYTPLILKQGNCMGHLLEVSQRGNDQLVAHVSSNIVVMGFGSARQNCLHTFCNKNTLTAEAVKNGLPIPPNRIFFGFEIVFSSIPPLEIVSLIQAPPILCSRIPPLHLSSLPQSTTSKFDSSTSNFV